MAAREATVAPDYSGLPGWELIRAGLEDLAAGRDTIAGELVRGASGRLSSVGLDPIEDRPPRSPHRLYELIEADVGAARAHARYNALRRRLSSFLRALPDARTG